jgi:parallel beta-helix repeat protein
MLKKVLAVAVTLAFLVSTTAVGSASANFLPPPPQLPYIRVGSDGTITPATAPIHRAGNTYTLTGDIFNYTLDIQKPNVVLEGAGHFLQGNGSGIGVLLNRTNSITVRNVTLTKFSTAILLDQSSDDTITANTVTNCGVAISLNNAHNTQVSANKITSNGEALLLYASCDQNSITNNAMYRNDNGIWCEVAAYGETNDQNTIANNKISNNGGTGILLRGCANDTVESNTITGNNVGISLYGTSCTNNIIAGNNLDGNTQSNFDITGDAKQNTIAHNQIANSAAGIHIFNANVSRIFLNNFVDNQKQVFNEVVVAPNELVWGPANNVWDVNEQGNYWSDRPVSNATYIIDFLNVDHHPLDAPASTDLSSFEVPSLSMPQEYLNYTITDINGTMWATIEGIYPIHLSGSLINLPMVYPTPPNATNIRITLDGTELAWGNYSGLDPTALHLTDIGDWQMVYCTITPASSDFLLQIHYQHPLQVINGSYTFLYDLNIVDYLSLQTPNSTAHFTVKLPANSSGMNVYTTGITGGAWTPVSWNLTESATAKTASFDVISEYGQPLNGDIAFILQDKPVPEFPVWILVLLLAAATLTIAVFAAKLASEKSSLVGFAKAKNISRSP